MPQSEVPTQDDFLSEHLVRIHIPLKGTMPTTEELDTFHKLEDDLDRGAKKAAAGELDGNEMGGGEYTIWLYGPDASTLAEVVKTALKGQKLPRGCQLFLRHGGVNDENAREEVVAVDSGM